MVIDHHYHHLQQVRSALSVIIHPLRLLAALPVTASLKVQTLFATRDTLYTQNAELRRNNLQLQAKLQQYSTLEAENQRLRQLLKSSSTVGGERMLIAELIAVDLDPYRQQVTINKGTLEGAFVGQAVLDAAAVMGQVQQATLFSSTVLLITDANHAMPVQILRNGLRTLAIGTGRINALELPYLPTHSDIQVGDQLVTSGLGGTFPAGYPVAIIRKIDRHPNQAFARIHAEPLAHLDRSREVLLVWENPSQNTP